MRPDVRIPVDLKEDIEDALLRRIPVLEEAHADRDANIRDYEALLSGDNRSTGSPRWPGACQADDPITKEHHQAIHAAVSQSSRLEPHWLVEPSDPEDEEDASTVEAWLHVKYHEYELAKIHYDLAYNALRDPFAILYCGWRQEYEHKYQMQWIDPKTHDIFTNEADLDPTVDYEESPVLIESVRYEGADLRVVEPTDFWLDPPEAQSVEDAEGVWERLYYTRSDLLLGIQSAGYDEDAVLEILRRPPEGYSLDTARGERDNRDGIDTDLGSTYECHMYCGRLPVLLDRATGKPRLRRELWGLDFTILFHKPSKQILKWGLMPFGMRPYIEYHTYRKPNRLMGDCVPSLLRAIQDEASANYRLAFDDKNLATNPVLTCSKTDYQMVSQFSIYPGAVIPYTPGEGPPRALEFDKSCVSADLAFQQDLRSRAADMMSARVYGHVEPKVRKAAEIDAAMQTVNTKFDLVLSCFQEGDEKLAVMLINLHEQYMPASGETVRAGAGKSITVTPQQLRKKFRYLPHANSENANPQMRLAKIQMLMQAVRNSPLYAKWIQGGNFRPEWAMLRRLLEMTGERNVNSWIGPEPEEGPDAQMMLQQLMQVVAQGAQAGDPVCQQIIQMAQQMMQGGGQQASQEGQDGMAPPNVQTGPANAMPIAMGPQGFAAQPPNGYIAGGEGPAQGY